MQKVKIQIGNWLNSLIKFDGADIELQAQYCDMTYSDCTKHSIVT